MEKKEIKPMVDGDPADQDHGADDLFTALLRTVPGAAPKLIKDAARHERIWEKIQAGFKKPTQTG